jgi:hypothetical protein
VAAFFDIARLAGRNTILKGGFASSRLWNNVIDGKPQFFGAAISAFKSISDKDIFFAKGHTGSINGTDKLY